VPLALVACSQSLWFGKAAMPAAQANAAVANTSEFHTGRADRTLNPVDGDAIAVNPYASRKLTLVGTDEAKVCFSAVYGAQHFPAHESVSQDNAERLEGAKAIVITIEARDSFADLTEQSEWPKNAPPTQVTSARVLDSDLEKKDTLDDNGNTNHTEWLTTTFEVCGAAPAVTPSSKYLVVTSYPGESTKPPAFFVWTLEDAQ
jgi:hypothetical protein